MFYLVAEQISTDTDVILKSDVSITKVNRAKRREYPGYRKLRTIQGKYIEQKKERKTKNGLVW